MKQSGPGIAFSERGVDEPQGRGCRIRSHILKVIYHPLYSMNNFVKNKSKLPQDGAQQFIKGD